ncbi:MAG: hypothetical protein ABEK75_08300 [Salinibacter sp.]
MRRPSDAPSADVRFSVEMTGLAPQTGGVEVRYEAERPEALEGGAV